MAKETEPGGITCPGCGAGMAVEGANASCSGCGEQLRLGEAVSLMCWMDCSRECSSSCVAWDTRGPEDKRLSSCIHLNAKRSIAKSLGAIASAMHAAAVPGAPVVT